jgi:hypothetical protein
MPLSFQEYFVRFERAALYQKAHLIQLSNGGCIAQFGTGFRFAIMSGLHGDEPSGPLAILEWLENLPENYSFNNHLWIAPLVNDDGWNTNKREWHNQDLNRSFNETAPDFLKTIMISLKVAQPNAFLDLHEDSSLDFPYIYHFTGDKHPLTLKLASHLGVQLQTWSDFADWETASEIYIRRLGCDRCFTVEVPPKWPLQKRVELHIKSIVWLEEKLKTACDTL